ncbi:LIC12015 family putative lipoprotein [Leptospira noguchii]|uniref:Uncharacterized protein n=1 Tax=Leptospira noguchii TaxID=28182 RepID=A0A9Q8VVW0_9LEPT|nr:hypothetical protein [Leptospira noguchii]TQE66291.1 hypothetical protein FF021_18710 [Leptospira noguchii]UOG35484.1 hypothetical protein MAL02_07305 [Leptospira noguchii]UOG46404.1 hypothetical protein MAL01_07455 [Leptospira noguchii]UOG51339.1 hypothetical protein MAL09_11480 [Leptospira noguchii]UOG57968.1 hypothetical protein MAL03_07640 [Leptospira noguchii]
MKQKTLFLTIFSLLCVINCNRDSDVLASFKSGTVTREELRAYYKLRGIEPDPNTASIATQAKIVEEIGIQKIAEANNQNTNIVTKEEYNKIMNFVEPQVVFNDYRKKFSEKLITSGMLEFAFGRILFVKADPDKPQVSEERAKTLFQEIQKLKSDREISEFIAKNTDEIQRKAIGGRLEPHCINCGNDPFTSILKEAAQTKGNFILKQPSDPDPSSVSKQTAKDYYIIKVERIEKIYPKKIDKFFQNELDKLKNFALKYVSKEGITEEEKNSAKFYSDLVVNERANQTAEHYGNRFLREAWKNEMDSLKAKSGLKIVDLTPQFIKDLKSETILFEDQKGSKFSFKDLITEFNKIAPILQKRKGSLEEEKNDQLSFYAQIYLPIRISSESKEIQSLKDTKEFKKTLPLLGRSVLFMLIRNRSIDSEVNITEKEIRDTYEAGKLYAYSKPSSANPNERIPEDFGKVRARIKQELVEGKKQSIFQDYLSKLKSENEFKISSESLKAGQI